MLGSKPETSESRIKAVSQEIDKGLDSYVVGGAGIADTAILALKNLIKANIIPNILVNDRNTEIRINEGSKSISVKCNNLSYKEAFKTLADCHINTVDADNYHCIVLPTSDIKHSSKTQAIADLCNDKNTLSFSMIVQLYVLLLMDQEQKPDLSITGLKMKDTNKEDLASSKVSVTKMTSAAKINVKEAYEQDNISILQEIAQSNADTIKSLATEQTDKFYDIHIIPNNKNNTSNNIHCRRLITAIVNNKLNRDTVSMGRSTEGWVPEFRDMKILEIESFTGAAHKL